jgi:hypothetical protein
MQMIAPVRTAWGHHDCPAGKRHYGNFRMTMCSPGTSAKSLAFEVSSRKSRWMACVPKPEIVDAIAKHAQRVLTRRLWNKTSNLSLIPHEQDLFR